VAPPLYAKQAVTSTEASVFASSSDSYSFKGEFKALASVAAVTGNLCNKSCCRDERLSDRSADTHTEPAADTTRRGEPRVRVKHRRRGATGIEHFVAEVALLRQAEFTIYSSLCRPVSKTRRQGRLQPQTARDRSGCIIRLRWL